MLSSKRLKKLRKATHQSQEDMAYCMNISRAAYCMYENGYRQPSFETVMYLADFFQVSIDYLVGFSEIPLRLSGLSEEDVLIIRALSVCDRTTKDYVRHLLKVPSSYP